MTAPRNSPKHTEGSVKQHGQLTLIALVAIEVIDSKELARRWGLPESWVRDRVRSRAVDPIPHLKLGRNVRFEWGSARLEAWLAKLRRP